MYSRGWDALEYIFFTHPPARKCTEGGGRPLSTFLYCKKKCTQGGGTPLSTFSLLIPRQENVLKGVGPPPVHFLKKMYRHKGDVFLLYLFFFGGGVVFGLKKMY